MTSSRVVIEEVFRRSDQGVLRPFLCRGSDGEIYFVKGRGAGGRDLVAEYVGARLGTILGLPIPAFSIVEVSASLVNGSDLEGIWELGPGPAFGSMRVEFAQELGPSTAVRVTPELQARVLLFDWWIRNEDRTLTDRGGNPNLAWDMAGSELVVFDHNLAFDDEFDGRRFQDSHAFRERLFEFSDSTFRRRETDRLTVAMGEFAAIVAEIPEAWTDGESRDDEYFDIDGLRRTLDRFRSPGFWDLEL